MTAETQPETDQVRDTWTIELTHSVAGTLDVDYQPISVDERMSISVGQIMDAPAVEGWQLLKTTIEKLCRRVRLNGDEIAAGQIPDFWGLAVVLLHPSFRRRQIPTSSP